jgi:class 3 adenylate cyclase/tetratricopeptide (TPR) repeat protein
VPDHLAERIRAGRAAVEGERKHVTVLFADVMGSMDLAESQDPETWRRIMDRFFTILCDGVHKFEGTVDKFTGDGIMALFGAPIAHEDHAQRACYAALHLQEELSRYAADLRREQGLSFSVRIGINSGEVVVGTVGEDLGMSYTALGHTVGLAQRMEQLAEPGKAYLTAHTASLVEGYLALTDLGEFQVKGSSDSLRVYELIGVGAARGRLDVSRARGFSRFVGRDEELRTLEAALSEAREGRPRVIGVVADAGVGKSRLCDTFANRCRARGIPVYRASGQAHARSIPLVPVLEIMRTYFDVTELDSDQTARERIAGKLLLLDAGFSDDLPLIFDFLAVPDPERPPPRMDPEARQRLLLAITKRLIHAQGAREPGVTVFEDLHWWDPASEVFLAHHIEATQGTHGLTILNFRPEYHAAWMSKSYYQQIPLTPLGPEAVQALLRELLGPDPSLSGVGEMIGERTAGNPFFIEEVVRSLVESGNLGGERGAHRLLKPVENAAVPASVLGVLAARIDRLAEREKLVLQAAAVIGKEFAGAVLSSVVDLEAATLDGALRELVAGEFIFEQELYPNAIFAFAHPLTQEVAYGSQLAERRAAMHSAVAQSLVVEHPERLDEMAALLAQHWESAGSPLEAARWHARAGAWAGTRDPTASLRHWRMVCDLTDEIPDSDEGISLGLSARIFSLVYGWRLGMSQDETELLFSEAERMAARSQDMWSRAILLGVYSNFRCAVDGKFEEAATLGRQAIAIAEESADPALYVAVMSGASYSLSLIGESNQSLAVLDRAIEVADGDPTTGAGFTIDCPLAYAIVFKGGLLQNLGRISEGRDLIDRGMKLAAEQGAIETVGWGHLWKVNDAQLRGYTDDAVAHARQALEIAERIGDSFSRAWAWDRMGLAACLREDWRGAIEAVERSQAIATEHRTTADAEVHHLMTLGQAHLGLGDAERATALLREAVSLAERRGEVPTLALASATLARVRLAADGPSARDEIEGLLTHARDLVRRVGTRAILPQIHVTLAELARESGDASTHERELHEAHSLFAEMGATGHAERLAVELAALSHPMR